MPTIFDMNWNDIVKFDWNSILNFDWTSVQSQLTEVFRSGQAYGIDIRAIGGAFVAPLVPVAMMAAPPIYDGIRSLLPKDVKKKMPSFADLGKALKIK